MFLVTIADFLRDVMAPLYKLLSTFLNPIIEVVHKFLKTLWEKTFELVDYLVDNASRHFPCCILFCKAACADQYARFHQETGYSLEELDELDPGLKMEPRMIYGYMDYREGNDVYYIKDVYFHLFQTGRREGNSYSQWEVDENEGMSLILSRLALFEKEGAIGTTGEGPIKHIDLYKGPKGEYPEGNIEKFEESKADNDKTICILKSSNSKYFFKFRNVNLRKHFKQQLNAHINDYSYSKIRKDAVKENYDQWMKDFWVTSYFNQFAKLLQTNAKEEIKLANEEELKQKQEEQQMDRDIENTSANPEKGGDKNNGKKHNKFWGFKMPKWNW